MSRVDRLFKHHHLPAFLGYLILAALFYSPVLSGLRTFPDGDFTYHFLPFSLFQRSELLAGRLPIWNPYTYSGHPFLADVQAAVYYPLSNLLLGLTLPWSDPGARLYWLQVDAVLHVALAGFFTYLLVDGLTRNRAAAFLGGCVFAFSGYLTGYPPLQLAVLRTAIWLPLLLWLLLRAFAAHGAWRWWIAASATYAVAFLAGHPQTFLFISYATAGWIALLLFVSLRDPRERPRWRSHLLRVGTFYLLFLALSAAQMLPSVEFTGLSVRASADYDFLSGGFPIQDTWQMLLPRVLTVFSPIYVGVISLALALLAVIATLAPGGLRRPVRSAFVLYFALLALLALLVSYGANGFLYAILYRWLPGWKMFRGQERAAYLVAFGLSILAGVGGAALAQLPVARRRRFALTYALLAAVAVAVFAVWWQTAGRSAASPDQFVRIATTALVLLAAWVILSWPAGWSGRRWVFLVGLVLADLFLANLATNVSDLSPGQKVALKPEVLAVEQAVASDPQGNLGLPGRVYNEYRAFDDYGMRTGVEDAWGSSPLRLARYAALFDQFPLDRMWRLTGVEHVLTWRRELPEPGELLSEFPQATDSTYLHRLSELNPRAWVVPEVAIAGDEDALRLLADHGFDLAKTAIVPPSPDRAGGSRLSASGPLAPAGRSEVALEHLGPAHLRVRVHSDRGGLLVISENWMPGWQAVEHREGSDKGRSLPVIRANLAFLGVQIEPGDATIDLVYRPVSVVAGLILSGLTLILLCVLAIAHRQAWDMRWLHRVQHLISSLRSSPFASHLLPLSILLVALALRVLLLSYQELRGDEAFGYFFSQPPVQQIIASTISLREPHPVGSYLIEKAWLGLAGHSEFALRFTSVWFSVLAVALLYRLGRCLELRKPAALLAAALLAISPYAIWHSQDARMYGISLALTIASTTAALEAIARTRHGTATARRWLSWAVYVGVTWLALHVHYFAVFVIVAQNIWALSTAALAPQYRRTLRPWLLAQAVLLLLYLPWLVAVGGILTGYSGNGDSPGFAAMLARSLSVFGVGETVPAAQRLPLALLGAALIVIGTVRLAFAGSAGRRALSLLLLYLGLPVLATWVSALSRPIFNERYLIAAAPPFYLLLAVAAQTSEVCETPAASTRRDRRLGYAGAGALLVLLAGGLLSLNHYYFDPDYSKTRGWRELAATLARFSSELPPEDVRLAQTYPDPTLWYYYQGPVPHLVLPPAAHDQEGAAREAADMAAAGVERVVLASQPSEAWDERGLAEAALAGQFTAIHRTPVHGWPVVVYVRPPSTMTRLDVSFVNPGPDEVTGAGAGGLTLTESAVGAQVLAPGDVLPIFTRWRGSGAALTGTEKISLQLLDSGGALVAQTDLPFGPAEIQAPMTPYAILLPWQMAPGEYRLILALYDPAREGAPRLLTADGADHVELGVLRAP